MKDDPTPIITELEVALLPSAESVAAGGPTSTPLHPGIKDCWSRIGVGGDHTCGELARYIHCHNCPVYSAAATQFLDRPLPPEYRRQWTEHFAREKQIVTPAKTSAVLFRIGNEWLGLPTLAFQEIADSPAFDSRTAGQPGRRAADTGRRALHSLPHRRNSMVLGLVNVRGELLICASLGKLLGLEGTGFSVRSLAVFNRLLVSDWHGQRFAFPVDEVHGVHRFHSADLREPPATVARSGVNCAIGVFPWRNFTVGFLDPESLFAALNRNLS